jgi:hypothetical protein
VETAILVISAVESTVSELGEATGIQMDSNEDEVDRPIFTIMYTGKLVSNTHSKPRKK